MLALTPAGDDVGDTSAEVARFAARNDDWMVISLVFGLLSLLLLVWFVGGLYVRLRAVAAGAESVVVLVGGLILTLLFFLAITIWSAPLVDFESDSAAAEGQALTYLTIDDIGWVVLGGAGVGAGLMAIAASVAALRSRLIPAWAGWLGVALGVVALATIVFVGLFGWLIWIVLASLVMLRHDGRTTGSAPS